MRIVRTFGLALIAAAIIPAVVSAQNAKPAQRDFNDSWYWGLKGGSTMFTAGADGNTKVNAPTFGAEWLITRTTMALNISVDQSFFDDKSGVYDPTVAGSIRPVSISDMRRYQASVLFFPKRFGSLRPYAGIGFALNVIQNANPEGTYLSAESQTAILKSVNDQSSRASAAFTVGAQLQVQRAAIFAQGVTMPTRNNFLLNGSANTFMIEAGIRYNLVAAIEKF
ncbi:MAG: hypothetical protein ABIT38_00885 [Gemmatimonadaceae bacterium]